MKKLIIFGLAGLAVFLCALTILSQAREKMRIVCWGPHQHWTGDNSHWRNFPQIDSCFMNMLRVGTFKANEDFDSAAHYGFKLVENLAPHSSIVTGQQGIYEADDKYYLHQLDITPPYFDGYFSHSNRVGEEKLDADALNGYAWKADPDSFEAGYVLRGLMRGNRPGTDTAYWYNYELGKPHEYKYGNPVDTTTFYADFRIKISDTTYQADPFLILKAVMFDGANVVVLDSSEVKPQDFQNENQYQIFTLTFQRVYDSEEKKDEGDSLDYQIWWDGSRAVWVDRVDVRDAYADSLFGGLYDAKIDTLSQQQGRDTLLSAWYLVDQPDYDQYASQAYLVACLNSNQ